MHRRVELDPAALPRVVRALVRARGASSIAWLDGDGSALGRFSYVGVGRTRALARWSDVASALDALAPLATQGEPDIVHGAPQCTLALAYDLAWSMPIGIRRAPRLDRDPSAAGAWLLVHDATLAIDHAAGEAWIVGQSDALDAAVVASDAPVDAVLTSIRAEPRQTHRAAIERALEDIARGDIYQVNLARRFTATLVGEPLALALAMREASPVPLGAYIEGPPGTNETVVLRTMERFLSFDARTRMLETRPIKGTRAREAGGDDAAAEALLADEKERAEHAMIVDLMRNDLGRIAAVGTVCVREAMRVEPYARLSHLVSIVEAKAREGLSLSAILEATFPPGSVTGAPKLAAIERIEAYERFARGFYTGAVGHVARDASFSLAVSIRTAQIRASAVTYFAGGGIVEASDPERELDETELKAQVLFDAAERMKRQRD